MTPVELNGYAPHFRKALETVRDQAAARARQEVLASIGEAFVRQAMAAMGGGVTAAPPDLFAKAAQRAPAGGVSVGGKQFRGGEFIPSEVMDLATDEEKAAVAGSEQDARGGEAGQRQLPRVNPDPARERSYGRKDEPPAAVKQAFAAWHPTAEQKEALAAYTDPDDAELEGPTLLAAVRGGTASPKQQAAYRAVVGAVNSAPTLPEPVRVFRGFRFKNVSDRDAAVAKLAADGVYRLTGGVSSSSLDPGYAAGEFSDEDTGVVFDIETDRGAWVDPLAPSNDQREVLLPDGEFEVTAIGPAKVGRRGKTYTVVSLRRNPGAKTNSALFAKAAAHSPTGGVTIAGKHYPGGQFIPAEEMAKATPEEKAELERKQAGGDGKNGAGDAAEYTLPDAARDGVLPHVQKRAEDYMRSLGTPPPPPGEGMVRLYRGEWEGKTPHKNAFFSDDRGLAGVAVPFARSPGRHLIYVDVPEDVVKQGLHDGAVTDGEYALPEEYRKQVKVWGKEPPATQSTPKDQTGQYGAWGRAAAGIDDAPPPPASADRATKPMSREERAKRAEKAKAAVEKAVADPKAIKPHELRALHGHFLALSKEQQKEYARQLREKVGGTKAELADRLRERIKAERVKKEGTRVSTQQVPTLAADADSSGYEVVGRPALSKEAALSMNNSSSVVAVQKRGGKWVALRERGETPAGTPAEATGDIDMGTGARGRGTAAADVVGSGNTGDVIRDGSEVVKNTVRPDGSKSREGEFYKDLEGVVGVAPGRQDGDKVRLPHYHEVLSVDTVKDEADRKRMGTEVGKNKSRLLNAVNAMSEKGIDYNDPLQVGFDENYDAHVIDLSNAGKVDPQTALRANVERAARFMDDFGAEKAAGDIRRTFSVYSQSRLLSGVNPESAKQRMEAMAAKGNRTAQHIVSIGPEKVAKYDTKHVYYSANPRPVERDGILQSEPDADGLKVILSDKPLDADTIRQYGLTPVVHPADREPPPQTATPSPAPAEPAADLGAGKPPPTDIDTPAPAAQTPGTMREPGMPTAKPKTQPKPSTAGLSAALTAARRDLDAAHAAGKPALDRLNAMDEGHPEYAAAEAEFDRQREAYLAAKAAHDAAADALADANGHDYAVLAADGAGAEPKVLHRGPTLGGLGNAHRNLGDQFFGGASVAHTAGETRDEHGRPAAAAVTVGQGSAEGKVVWVGRVDRKTGRPLDPVPRAEVGTGLLEASRSAGGGGPQAPPAEPAAGKQSPTGVDATAGGAAAPARNPAAGGTAVPTPQPAGTDWKALYESQMDMSDTTGAYVARAKSAIDAASTDELKQALAAAGYKVVPKTRKEAVAKMTAYLTDRRGKYDRAGA